MLSERGRIVFLLAVIGLVLFGALRHLKAQSDLANSIEYKSALLLELWAVLRELDDEKVLQAKKVILHDLLAEDQNEIKKTVCENIGNLKLDGLSDEYLNENRPKCPDRHCSSDSQDFQIDRISIKEKAFEYLVTNFKNINYEKNEKINFKDEHFNQVVCESNPELNNYIFKPKFSRDQFDYDVSREGYTPRRLVCDEISKHEVKVQSIYWLDNCDDVAQLGDIVTVIGQNISDVTVDHLKQLRLKGVNILPVEPKTPYYLLMNSHFDFDADDANIWRMVREAENQNADIVAGSWRNEAGQWKSSCLHFSMRNYTLEIWEGYYKSISSMKYCDFSFGPLLIRSNVLDRLIKNSVDLIDFHFSNPKLRTIMCSDCMFYAYDSPRLEKTDLLPLARRYSLTNIKLQDEMFEFTCPEADIKCDVKYFDSNGLAQPPCCLKVLTGMMYALVYEYEMKNASLCIYCGQVLAVLKMPGGQLPWDTDLDAPMFATDFYHVTNDIMPSMGEYGLKPSINAGRHKENELGEIEGGAITIKHLATGYTTDNYAKAPSKLKCGHGHRGRTFIKLDGIWVPGPDNPGKYGRTYGDEILRHVLHVKSSTNTYNNVEAAFRKCDAFPEHACLASYPTDGNLQFRTDQHRLLPLS